MPLSEADYLALKNDITITNSAEFAAAVAANDDQAIANAYNLAASPTYLVWRTKITAAEYTGFAGIVWAEVDTLTAGKGRIFEWMTSFFTKDLNAAEANVRQGAQDTFGAGTTSRSNLIALFKRACTRVEKLFAIATPGGSGTRGSSANPDLMVFEGTLTGLQVAHALRNVPIPFGFKA